MNKIDLHTHTRYSDGMLTINEVLQVAKEKSLSCIAITDHYTTSWKLDYIKSLNKSTFDSYIDEIKKERKLLDIKCLIGVEIDTDSKWNDIIMFPFEKFEIILLEYINAIETLERFVHLIESLELNSIISLAHNSCFKQANLQLFAKILAENNIYFEINTAYHHPSDEDSVHKLMILRENGVKFTIGSDSHERGPIGETHNAYEILNTIDGMDSLINVRDIKI